MKKASEIVLDCLEEKKLSQRQLAARMGEDVRYLNQQLKRQNDMKDIELRLLKMMAFNGYARSMRIR